MTHLSEKIIHEHLVRKTAKQKAAFRKTLIEEMNAMSVEAHEEKSGGLISSVNVVIGDAEKAEMIFGAHYDTAPRMIVPNFITPRNPLVYILYQLLVVVGMLIPAIALSAPVGLYLSKEAGKLVWFAVYCGLLALMIKGPANPNTFNDNTSGVVALIELMERMPEGLRSRCAFVFFDNEELGMVGSSAFRAKHKRVKDVPMVNMDCVGDGEHLLLASAKAFRADARLYGALQAAFETRGPVLDVKAETTVYPSDQMGFRKSLAMASLKKARIIGYYMDRIHTAKDTVLCPENIHRVAEGLAEMAGRYLDNRAE